jgi:hypothetical protein
MDAGTIVLIAGLIILIIASAIAKFFWTVEKLMQDCEDMSEGTDT